jgi:hypothetical protein
MLRLRWAMSNSPRTKWSTRLLRWVGVAVVPRGRVGINEIATAHLREAQPAWEAIGFAGRRTWLHRFCDCLERVYGV